MSTRADRLQDVGGQEELWSGGATCRLARMSAAGPPENASPACSSVCVHSMTCGHNTAHHCEHHEQLVYRGNRMYYWHRINSTLCPISLHEAADC